MANEPRQTSGSEILSVLHALSLDTESEILSMPRDQVQARLSDDGINLDSAKAEIASRLKAIRGQQRLADAREQRLVQESAISSHRTPSSLSIPQMRIEVERLLGLLAPTKTPAVQAYFNRFSEAADDDLPGLLDDLHFLEDQSKEGQ